MNFIPCGPIKLDDWPKDSIDRPSERFHEAWSGIEKWNSPAVEQDSAAKALAKRLRAQ